MKRYWKFAAAAAFVLSAGTALAEGGELPKTLVWTTYGTGATANAQSIAIGSVLKQTDEVNLRILPGKNDISRLLPLLSGKAQFSATGSDNVYSQEGVFTFGERAWGPQPTSILMHNISDACSSIFSIAGDLDDVNSMADLKGKRLGLVRSSAAFLLGAKAQLAFAGLTLDDVEVVDVGSNGAAVDGIIAGQVDFTQTSTASGTVVKMQAGPRGVKHIETPHDDAEGWARLQAVVPWYQPQICTVGAAVPEGGMEGITSPYPVLIAINGDDDLAYAMTKWMHENIDNYRDKAPANGGWALDRQNLEGSLVPINAGAVRYYKEIGAWTDAAEANRQKGLMRQKVLRETWDEYVPTASQDAEEFKNGWAAARAAALKEAGLPVLFESW